MVKKDFRLLPLNRYERMYAAASHMNLDDVSSYVPYVRDFLNNKTPQEAAKPHDLLYAFRQHTNLDKLGVKPLSNEELEHLSRYLLYEAEQRYVTSELYILVVLPRQRRIIGKEMYSSMYTVH